MYEQEGYELVGAALEVYNTRKFGFYEDVYQECMEIELTRREIPFESQPELKLDYKGVELEKRFRPDFIVHDGIIVELKVVRELGNPEIAQLINYLKASGKFRVGYLLNFGNCDELEWKRFVL